MSSFDDVKKEWQGLFYSTLGGAMQMGSNLNLSDRVKSITSQLEGVAKIAGSYIEYNLNNLRDKDQVDSQIGRFVHLSEKFIRETVSQKVSQLAPTRVKIKIKKLENFNSKELPKYQSTLASGFDVCAQIKAPIVLKAGERVLVPTGLSFEIPEGYEIQARPRSGWAIRDGISLVNSPGTIDADYRGEVKIVLINQGQQEITIHQDDRIAQLVLCPVVRAIFEETYDLSKTDRGEGGFGSTGKKGKEQEASPVKQESEVDSEGLNLGNV